MSVGGADGEERPPRAKRGPETWTPSRIRTRAEQSSTTDSLSERQPAGESGNLSHRCAQAEPERG